jgi:hypothetical protein
MTVPPAVPSLRTSAQPCAVSSITKKTFAPTAVRSEAYGQEKSGPPGPGSRSTTIAVPPAVPSLRQSSKPCVPSSATKYRSEAVGSSSGKLRLPEYSASPASGLTSTTSSVPAFVPSLLHSSQPWTPSLPAKYRAPPNGIRSDV